MDLIDIFWNLSQSHDIQNLQAAQLANTSTHGRQAAAVRRLEAENHELKIRMSVLLRLLLDRGIFTMDDYARLVGETQTQLAALPAKALPKRRR